MQKWTSGTKVSALLYSFVVVGRLLQSPCLSCSRVGGTCRPQLRMVHACRMHWQALSHRAQCPAARLCHPQDQPAGRPGAPKSARHYAYAYQLRVHQHEHRKPWA